MGRLSLAASPFAFAIVLPSLLHCSCLYWNTAGVDALPSDRSVSCCDFRLRMPKLFCSRAWLQGSCGLGVGGLLHCPCRAPTPTPARDPLLFLVTCYFHSGIWTTDTVSPNCISAVRGAAGQRPDVAQLLCKALITQARGRFLLESAALVLRVFPLLKPPPFKDRVLCSPR